MQTIWGIASNDPPKTKDAKQNKWTNVSEKSKYRTIETDPSSPKNILFFIIPNFELGIDISPNYEHYSDIRLYHFDNVLPPEAIGRDVEEIHISEREETNDTTVIYQTAYRSALKRKP